MNQIAVVSIGYGSSEMLTEESKRFVLGTETLILRTKRHPIVKYLELHEKSYETLDSFYENSDSFDMLNRNAAEFIIQKLQSANVCYCVNDPLNDSIVSQLKALLHATEQIIIVPGISYAQVCLSACCALGGARIYSAEEFLQKAVSPSENLLITELHSRECAGECKLHLLEYMPEETTVKFVSGIESNGKTKVQDILLYEMDRIKKYDHLCAVYIPAVSYSERNRFDCHDLIEIMEKLSSPEGCPWDRKQTHESLMPYLFEECGEFLQSVQDGDPEEMADELGDVLLQVIFHADVAKRHGEFNFSDVTSAICSKMIKRHPTQFGGGSMNTPEDWERLKREDRGIVSDVEAMRAVSMGIGPLRRAEKVLSKAEKYQYPVYADELDNMKKIIDSLENTGKNQNKEKLFGDLLLSCVAAAKAIGVDSEISLIGSTERFIDAYEQNDRTDC